MKLGVLGGTFDPPHIAHLILAEQARDQLSLDRVLFIPAGDPWRKADRDVAPATHRLAMTRLLVNDDPAFAVDACEVEREGPTYTVDTLRLLRGRMSAADELFLIVGEDALADLPAWRDPAEIAALAKLAVAERDGDVAPEGLPFGLDRIVRVNMPSIAISSTALRERVRAGRSLRYLTPAAVEAYIKDNGLYAG
ncbi:MAG TPA: nicotinate-nucleotide adenylyltransferase [Dehalococcoidia bacterium]|nr:nicotinate-nucleotide adenylyltransferase [Dehalococcoidia bacterium]